MTSSEGAARHPGPGVIRGPDDAALLLSAVFDGDRGQRQVVLSIGAERRLVGFAARDTKRSREPFEAAHVIDIAYDAGAASVVIATVNDRTMRTPRSFDRDAYERMGEDCAEGGVMLLDWLVLTDHRWWSMREQFGAPAEPVRET